MGIVSLQGMLRWCCNRLFPAALVLVALVGLGLLGQKSETMVYDVFQRWSAKPTASSPVVLVLIDDTSLMALKNRLGAPPWPRKTLLSLFERIQNAHPELMVLDSHFINTQSSEDSQTFTALKRFPNLVTGLVLEDNAGESSRLNTLLPTYYRLNLGVVSMEEDTDGTIRTLHPLYTTRTLGSGSALFPALSLAAAYEYRMRQQPESAWLLNIQAQETPPLLTLTSEKHPALGVRLPLNGQQSVYMRWYQPLYSPQGEETVRSHVMIPLSRFFEEGPLPDLTGKIALIGASAQYFRDYHKTPLSYRHLGPDIQATAIDNILQGEAIQKASPWLNISVWAGLSLLVFFICLTIRHLEQTLLYTLGFMVMYFWVAFQCFSVSVLWLDVVTPELFMSASFLLGNACRSQFKERQLAAMEKTMSQLVDPEVFQEIRRRSHVLKPGGQKLEITSMFVDIRQFTTLSERLQPAAVTDLLNAFYEAVVQVVFTHHGTVDKFMGDGILIIFGAPLPQADHRAMALHAAQDLLRVTTELSAQWQATQGITLEIGISLHSGMAFVGFLGPMDKLEYTAVGDTVNTCVRLQELTKSFKTRLIVSEQTLMPLQESEPLAALYLSLGTVSVRGREATLQIFTQAAAMAAQDDE